MKTYLIGLTSLATGPLIKLCKEQGIELPNAGIDAAGISPMSPIGMISLLDGHNNPEQTRKALFRSGALAHIYVTMLTSVTLKNRFYDFAIMQTPLGTVVTGSLERWAGFLALPRHVMEDKVAEFAESIVEHFVLLGVPQLCNKRIL